MPVVPPQSPALMPRCWHRPYKHDGTPANWAVYTCPLCLYSSVIEPEQGEIQDSGALDVDFTCPNRGCTYAAPLRLKGWTEQAESIRSQPSIPDEQPPQQDQP